MHWSQFLWVALGGAMGACSRFWVSSWVYQHTSSSFPWGTLAVNALGSFLFGILFVVIMSTTVIREPMRLLVLVGFLGAFTTFSTFSFEVMRLMEEGLLRLALLNAVSSLLICFLGVWLGDLLAKSLF